VSAASAGKRVSSIVASVIAVGIVATIVRDAGTWSGIIDTVGKVFDNSLRQSRGLDPRR